MQPPLVVGEDQEVIDIADVAQPEPVGDEVIERVEVDKLMGRITRGVPTRSVERVLTPVLELTDKLPTGGRRYHNSFPRSAWECRLRRSASSSDPRVTSRLSRKPAPRSSHSSWRWNTASASDR